MDEEGEPTVRVVEALGEDFGLPRTSSDRIVQRKSESESFFRRDRWLNKARLAREMAQGVEWCL